MIPAFLVSLTIKTTIIFLAGLGAAAALRRQSAALRHWTLAVALICAAVVPPLGLVVPAWQVPMNPFQPTEPVARTADVTVQVVRPYAGGAVVRNGAALDPSSSGMAFPIGRTFVMVWLVGFAASIGLLIAGATRLAFLVSRSRRIRHGRWIDLANAIARTYGIRRPLRLFETDHPTLLVTWGTWRPAILVPAAGRKWSDERIGVVLSHELAHVRRMDWAVQLAAAIVRSIYWFNPLAWTMCARTRHESEQACDDDVLNLGVDRTAYAAHLVEIARDHRRTLVPAFPVPAIAHRSTFEQRITAMLNSNVNRRPLTPRARTTSVLALSIVTLALAGAGAQTFATLTGTMSDQSGGRLPAVTVTLVRAGTTAKYEIQTDPTGRFELVGLLPGEYTLDARLPGFAESHQTMTLAAGRTNDMRITMQVGSIEETIRVVGGDIDRSQPLRVGDSARWAAKPACASGSGAPGAPIGGQILSPAMIVRVSPVYPEALRGTNTEGRVVLEARVDEGGFVRDVRVATQAHPALEQAAVQAVAQWQFTPTLLNCVPVEIGMTATVHFSEK